MASRTFFISGPPREVRLEGRSIAARALCSPKTIPSTLRTIDSREPWVWRLAPWIAVTPPTSARISAYRSWVPFGSFGIIRFCGSRTRSW